MGWEKILSLSNRRLPTVTGCTISIAAESKEAFDAKSKSGGHNSKLQISQKQLDDLRLRVKDRFDWLIDKENKSFAIQLSANGNTSIIAESNKGTKVRMHMPRAVAAQMRDLWNVGNQDRLHSFAVELVPVGDVIEIRRVTK